MTPFVEFSLQCPPNAIKITNEKSYLRCGEDLNFTCHNCPNFEISAKTCNHFTKDEIIYLKSNYPELLL